MSSTFVIHLHTGRGPDHYDLMLARGETLATWRLAQSPDALAEGAETPARKLPDHRVVYLTYEGPISRGRGEIKRVDRGTYEMLDRAPARWEVRLDGRTVTGRFELTAAQPDAEDWTLRRLAR